jgi:hypothetical protein
MAIALRSFLRVSLALVGAVHAFACGGTEETERPTRPDGRGDAQGVDTSSCEDVVKLFEFAEVEPFDESSVQDSSTNINAVTGLPDDPVGWWVSTDGSNANFRPHDTGFTACAPDAEQCTMAEIPADFATTEGGAASLLAGDGQCEASDRYMMIGSGAPGFGGWGMKFGANMRGPLRDARDWDGVALWARRTEESVASSFAFIIPDKYTSNQDGDYFCRDGLEVENLCDAFGRAIDVDTEWRVYFLPFDTLAQQGFGKASPLGALDVGQIVGLSFEFGTGTFEFHIDEIVYFREK